jgi:hypothetical protein
MRHRASKTLFSTPLIVRGFARPRRGSAWRAVVATIVVVPLAISVYRRVFDPVDVSLPPAPPYTVSMRSERPLSALEDQIDSRTATETARLSVMTRAKPIAASSRRGPQPVSRHVVAATRESEAIGQTVQLRLPRSALLLFGIPVIEPEVEGAVNVELLLSEDGQARTIRIVR